MITARSLVCLLLVAGCDPDLCAGPATGEGGVVEPGIGTPFVPLVDGGDGEMTVGFQGSYMFQVNARVSGLAITEADIVGVEVTITNSSGASVRSGDLCRPRQFVPVAGQPDQWELASLLFAELDPSLASALIGGSATLHIEVTDPDGLRASATRTFVAREGLTPGVR